MRGFTHGHGFVDYRDVHSCPPQPYDIDRAPRPNQESLDLVVPTRIGANHPWPPGRLARFPSFSF